MNDQVSTLIEKNLAERSRTLDLGNCGLHSIPDSILKLTHLEELNLGTNYIESQTNSWVKSSNNGPLNQIDTTSIKKLSGLQNLKTLFINKNNIKNISFLNYCKNLKRVYLNENKVKNFKGVKKNKVIKILSLYSNIIDDISGISNFPNLIELNLSHNKLENISNLQSLLRLRKLNLASNNIEKITNSLFTNNINELDVRSNKLNTIKFLQNSSQLLKLDISNNKIEDINQLSSLINIVELDCSNINCRDFTVIGHLSKLKILDISGNKVDTISFFYNSTIITTLNSMSVDCKNYKFLNGLSNLLELDLSFTNISDLSFITNLSKIKILKLSHVNGLSSVSELFKSETLESLEISGASLVDISNIGLLINLTKLDIGGNDIIDISALKNCTKLQILDISFNNIQDITSISELKEITDLDLSYNRIKELNPIKHLKKINKLDISGYEHIDNLFDGSTFPSLEILKVSSCKLKNIKFLANNNKIINLDLSKNSIRDITTLNKLVNIEILDLSNNPIISFDPLKNLPKLHSLDLSGCEFVKINLLKDISYLTSLSLNSTKLVDISFLANYKNLYILELSNNNIEDISPLENLNNLKTIDLKNNKIKKIPFNFFENIQIDWHIDQTSFFMFDKANFSQNPIEYPPLEVIKQGREFIKEFYNNIELKNLNECKVILVGRGKVGKTSLQKRLTGDKFLKNEPETHGIRKVIWENTIKDKQDNDITVNIWDFGGQYIQQTLHQFFYSSNTIYILVLDKRIDEDPEDFLELIRVYGKNSQVIIVYNYAIDLENTFEPFLYNSYPDIDSSLKNKYPNIYPKAFGVCCGLDNDNGINNLRNHLISIIPTLDHVTKKYPATWINIKNDIVKLVEKNYIPFSEFEQLCKIRRIEKSSLQEDLANMLNDIGTITFFNKQFLGNYYILNPDWVSAGAYQIILSTHTTTKKGYITLNDLDIIFSTPLPYSYRPIDYRFILQLMDEFDLCHKFNKDEWLIPSSLDGQSRLDLTEYKKKTYRLYFLSYEISLPSSIIHRFIARNVNYAYNDDYWRNGIVVKHPDSLTYIYVEADKKDRQIRLWITGEQIRECWEFFRKDFQEFSQNFQYNEYVSLDSKNTFKVSYKDLLACIRENELKWFIPGFGKIDVYETLGLFTDIKNLEKMKKEENPQNKTENNFYGNLHISGNVGNFASTGDAANSFINPSSETSIKEKQIDMQKEKRQNEYRDHKVKAWQKKGWIYLSIFLFIILFSIIFILYKVDWSLDYSSEKWKLITNNLIYVLLSAVAVMLLNGVFIKLIYDKYFSHSNIKAFREMIKLPDNLK